MEPYERQWRNYYDILGIAASSEPLIITAAYGQLAYKYQADATTMAEINEAYAILSDPMCRAAYDRALQVRYAIRDSRPPVQQVRTEPPPVRTPAAYSGPAEPIPYGTPVEPPPYTAPSAPPAAAPRHLLTSSSHVSARWLRL